FPNIDGCSPPPPLPCSSLVAPAPGSTASHDQSNTNSSPMLTLATYTAQPGSTITPPPNRCSTTAGPYYLSDVSPGTTVGYPVTLELPLGLPNKGPKSP
ncbi:unnamed protein product, partial [Urochloa humidicola]